jgi:hypothetical protein
MSRKTSDWRRWWFAPKAPRAPGETLTTAVGPRSHVQRVLERARDRTVVLGGDEEDPVGAPDAVAEGDPGLRRALFEILVIERQVPDLDDLEPEALRRHLGQGVRRHPVVRALAQAPHDHRHVALLTHEATLLLADRDRTGIDRPHERSAL